MFGHKRSKVVGSWGCWGNMTFLGKNRLIWNCFLKAGTSQKMGKDDSLLNQLKAPTVAAA
jgi:hypothetical protein